MHSKRCPSSIFSALTDLPRHGACSIVVLYLHHLCRLLHVAGSGSPQIPHSARHMLNVSAKAGQSCVACGVWQDSSSRDSEAATTTITNNNKKLQQFLIVHAEIIISCIYKIHFGAPCMSGCCCYRRCRTNDKRQATTDSDSNLNHVAFSVRS